MATGDPGRTNRFGLSCSHFKATPMTRRALACVILAAGKGTRMKSALPKVMHRVAGRPMISHVLATAASLQPERIVTVIGPEMDELSAAVAPCPTVVQVERHGTADAVRTALPLLEGFEGEVLVLYGDTPLLTESTLTALVEARRSKFDPAVVVLGMRLGDPGAYGRLIVDGLGDVERIVEYLDASPAERAVTLCNGGLMAFDSRRLPGLLDRIDRNNAKGEYYLTDAVALARADGHSVRYVECSPDELIGINSRADLAEVERIVQRRLRRQVMLDGATLIDPDSVHLSLDTKLGHDVVVHPFVVFGPGVTVGDGVEIRSFSHLEQTTIAPGAAIGPYARLRPGSEIGAGAHIGNFVEIKNSRIEAGAKVNHLTYLGDATVGAKANIGAGTITCNYDGIAKHRTEIGAGAFIGSNSALVAPVTIGAQATVGAGSVITAEVPADALAVARGRQQVYPGWTTRFRADKGRG